MFKFKYSQNLGHQKDAISQLGHFVFKRQEKDFAMQSYEQLILHNYAAIVTYIADNRIHQLKQDLL